MRALAAFLILTSPALAHHEAVVASTLPVFLPWIAFASAAVIGVWQRTRLRRWVQRMRRLDV